MVEINYGRESVGGVQRCAYVKELGFGPFMNWMDFHDTHFCKEWNDNTDNRIISNVLRAFKEPDSFIFTIDDASSIPFASQDVAIKHPYVNRYEIEILNSKIGLVHGTDYVEFEGSYYYSFNAVRTAFRELTKLTAPQYQNILDEIIEIYHEKKENHAIKRAEYLKAIETQIKSVQNAQEEAISSTQDIIPKTKGMLVIRMTGRAKFVISTDIQSKLLSLDELTDSMEEITLECFDDEVMPSEADVIMIENISKNNIAAAIIMYK